MALLLGGLLTTRLLRRSRSTQDLRTLHRVMVGADLAALASALWLLGEQVTRAGTGAGVLLSSYGARWSLRTAGLVLVLVVLVRSRERGSRSGRALLGLGLAGSLVGTAALGHVAVSSGGNPVLVAVDALHVAATLTWVGALACWVVLAPRWLTTRRGDELTAVLRSFARPAGACVAGTVVTGLVLSGHVVASVDAALATFYGRTLILKLALVAIAGLCGATSYLRLRRGTSIGVRALVAETFVLLLVVLTTATLTSGAPADEPRFVRAAAATRGPVDGAVHDLQVSAALQPNRPGTAIALVSVFDTRRPAPAPITEVDLTVGGGPVVPLHPLPDHQWTAPVELTAPGRTTVTVTVHRPGIGPTVGRFGWSVGDPGRLPVRVSQAPLTDMTTPAAYALAALLGLIGLAAVAAAVVRRSSPAAEVRLAPQPSVRVLVASSETKGGTP